MNDRIVEFRSRHPWPCSYYVLIVSGLPLDFGGVFDLEWAMLPRSPQDIAGAVAESLGLEAGEPGWSAQLTQGQCRRRD